MRVLNLLPLLPFAFAAPAKPSIPELSVSEWHSIQSSFESGIRWSLSKAEEIIGIDTTIEPDPERTIWGQLKADPNSFSKLVKILEFEQSAIRYLDGKNAPITFFAPNNDALTPKNRSGRRHHDDDDDDDDDDDLVELMRSPSLATLSAVLEAEPELMIADDDDDDDHKKRHRRERFKFIAGKVLQYHGLPEAYTIKEIKTNSTVATALKADDGSYGGLQRRIRIVTSFVPPAVSLNFYAKVLVSDIKSSNGYLHTIDHPLIPPGSIFDEAYLFPDVFSTLTSATQDLDLRKFVDWHYDRERSTKGNPIFIGAPLVTLFAPTNAAFGLLPPELKLFLFSPFGRRALAKVLAYHYVPRTLLLSELLYTEREESDAWGFSDQVEAIEYFSSENLDHYHKELTVKPALENTTLHVEIIKRQTLPIEGVDRIFVKVNNQYVSIIDVPARNGAIHAISKVLVPPHEHHDHDGADISSVDSWDNWSEWLPAWVDEE